MIDVAIEQQLGGFRLQAAFGVDAPWVGGLGRAVVRVVAVGVGALCGGRISPGRGVARPGMGTLLLNAVNDGETNGLLPWLLVTGALIVGFNLLADILYGVLDPRVRLA